MNKLILAILCLSVSLNIYGQSYDQFDQLIKRADSSHQANNYPLSIKYYEEAELLPDKQKPEIFGLLYYDMACVYSLNKDKEKSLFYLNKSFHVSSFKLGRTPVSASHLLRDSDWDFMREEPEFRKLMKDYFPKINLDILLAKEISYKELLENMESFSLTDDNGEMIIRDKIIYWEKDDSSYIFNSLSLPLPNKEVMRTNAIVFDNCTFKLNFIWETSSQKQLFPYSRIQLESCKIEGRFFVSGIDFIYSPQLFGNEFSNDIWMLFKCERGYFGITDCTFHYMDVFIDAENPIILKINDNVSRSGEGSTFYSNSVSDADFNNNSFEKDFLNISIEKVDKLRISGNQIKNLYVVNTTIQSEFDLQRNVIHDKFGLLRTYFSNEPVNDIDWADLDGFKIAILRNSNLKAGATTDSEGKYEPEYIKAILSSGESVDDISNPQSFDELMGLYSMFLNLYKNKNSIESYNKCFIMMKELQSKRLKYLYESNKTFKTYFRWKLSQFLKFYVNHGTDPAQAIVISLYIIFWFGVFFFFFPSDWDTTSKKKLIENYKDFIQKNEKGYVKPFFILIGGFFLSLLNALTLSLNAFITLGFGNIPTHGIARYICVLEGFLGWFLLSIFTVALINQVI